MKQNYEICIIPRDGREPVKKLKFRGSLWQANKAFEALRVALHCSETAIIHLRLIGANETGYVLNSVFFKEHENGV